MQKKVKPVIYVASPYTNGDAAINTHFQCSIFHELLDDDIVTPFTPCLLTFSSIYKPRSYDSWMKHDFELLRIMDGLLRLTARYPDLNYEVTDSRGADMEVEYCRQNNKPVFFNKEELYKWAGDFK